MGACTSSSEVVRDPVTGLAKGKKKKLGGAYPAQRRQAQPASASTGDSHFAPTPGGNALTLQPGSGGGGEGFINVTVPAGVNPGDTIHVRDPNGNTNAVVVPPGMGPGSNFMVQFDAGAQPPQPFSQPTPDPYETPTAYPTVVAQPEPVGESVFAVTATPVSEPYAPTAYASSSPYSAAPSYPTASAGPFR